MSWYVGHRNGTMELFKSATTPTFASHGETYAAVIGPFRTKRGAIWMAAYGRNNNPHCQTVDQAEYHAKRATMRTLGVEAFQ